MAPADQTKNRRFIQVDEEGYFHFDQVRITDDEFGRHLFANLRKDEYGSIITEAKGAVVTVEAFDEPLVARQIFKTPEGWRILMPHSFEAPFEPESLSLDQWDRFHGVTNEGIPFVLSRSAQAEFFNLLDEFSDTSITVDGKLYEIPDWLPSEPKVHPPEFWTEIYTTEESPGWELEAPAQALPDIVAQLKLPKSRVIVLGAGSGNDAAFFAQQGHIVTAVDFSDEAIERGRKKYGDLENLQFVKQDVFALPESYWGNFDLVFEHTCYCAIDPSRRDEMAKIWSRLLHENGHLLGVFFAMDKRIGPPFGGSEWEIRERLKKSFEFLYWTRWKHSIDRRLGKELVVYAKKKG